MPFKLLEEKGLNYKAKIHLCFFFFKEHNLAGKMKTVNFNFSKDL